MEREDVIKVEFLTSSLDCVHFIEKLTAPEPFVKMIAMPPLGFYTDEDVPRFMDMVLRDADACRDLIASSLDLGGGDVERVQ